MYLNIRLLYLKLKYKKDQLNIIGISQIKVKSVKISESLDIVNDFCLDFISSGVIFTSIM